MKEKTLEFLGKHDLIRRPAQAFARGVRAFVNSWNLYDPVCESNKTQPYAIRGKYRFNDRQQGKETLIVVLAGYKPSLWPEVLGRLARFSPQDVDVCIASSGLDSESLDAICESKGWSYLATARNHVSLVQNLAIHLHPSAQWIFKMDEDIYVTEGFLEKLADCHRHAAREIRFDIGFVAPLIPVNGYGHVRILEKLNLVKEWENRFGALKYTEGFYRNRQILQNPECARFMWGETCTELRDIDALNLKFQGGGYSICPIRFSIGAILFERCVWKEWGLFPVVVGTGMGEDERHVCEFCHLHSRAIVIAEDTVVGHLGYGPQTKSMLEFMEKRSEWKTI